MKPWKPIFSSERPGEHFIIPHEDARFLVEQGVSSGVLVALLAERGIGFLIAFLAIFKTGGIFLPLDPRHPSNRLNQILSQSGCDLVLTTGEFIPVLTQAIGEILSKSSHKYYNSKCYLLNTYGATECSDDQCHYPIYEPPPSDYRLSIMPIGRPIPNIRAYVLDHMLSPVPVGVVGELYLGGIGVGRGYLHDEQRTAQSFLPDPFSNSPGAKIYKTGDLARYLPDGTLEFLGRIDYQVKIRGYRIELGEIEIALKRHQAVMDMVVVARKDTPGDQRLVAYVVVQKDQSITVHDLQNHLMKQLPAYMVPSAIIFLEALPLNSNGKIDRKGLPEPERVSINVDEDVSVPTLPIHQQLKQIWEELLKVQPISIRDNFFDLGGHSLLAARLVTRIEQDWGKKIPLDALLTNATIEHLADVIQQPECTTPANSPPEPALEGKTQSSKSSGGLLERVVGRVHRINEIKESG